MKFPVNSGLIYIDDNIVDHGIASTSVALNFMLLHAITLLEYVTQLIYAGNCIVVYRHVIPLGSSTVKYPVNCPDKVTAD